MGNLFCKPEKDFSTFIKTQKHSEYAELALFEFDLEKFKGQNHIITLCCNENIRMVITTHGIETFIKFCKLNKLPLTLIIEVKERPLSALSQIILIEPSGVNFGGTLGICFEMVTPMSKYNLEELSFVSNYIRSINHMHFLPCNNNTISIQVICIKN